MRKLLKTILPVVTGILVILGILKADDLIKDLLNANYSFNPTDMGNVIFYYVLIPVSFLIALLIQWIIVQPIIRKLENKPTFWRLKLMHYIILITVVSAGVVAYLFWRKDESVAEVVVAFVTSFAMFFIYFIITVLVTKGIDQLNGLRGKEPNTAHPEEQKDSNAKTE